MGDNWWHLFTDGKVAWTYFGEDAGNGAAFLYGLRGDAFEDLSATHFRYNGVNGEYSDHLRTRAFNVLGEELEAIEVDGDANGYLVKPAADIKLEFTIENSGKSPATDIDYEVRISTDATFDKTDKVIAKGKFPSIVRDGANTLLIPAIMPRRTERMMRPGNSVYVGLLIDTTNKVKEFDSRNNVAYIPFIVE
jgi:hypothetical protein